MTCNANTGHEGEADMLWVWLSAGPDATPSLSTSLEKQISRADCNLPARARASTIKRDSGTSATSDLLRAIVHTKEDAHSCNSTGNASRSALLT